MKYIESITDFFKSPKWLTNLLLAAVCCIIPVVGPMVVLGWLITGFWSRKDDSPVTFPDFDFGQFVPWLQRGLWPVLVALVASLGIYFIFLIPMILVGVLIGSSGDGGGILALIGSLVMLGLQLLMMVGFFFVLKPLMIRATLVQDFMLSFDFKFVKRFVSLVWIEILISSLVIMVASFVLGLAGMIALCIGIFLVPPILYYAIVHLDKQLYQLYLSRGGEPIALSPKLTDSPVPTPLA